MANYVVNREDWSLYRKGQIDQQRHREKVKEAIKENLADIVSEEAIILSDGKKVIKVPIRSLEEYHFRFNLDKADHGGSGDGDTAVGDVLGSDRGGGKAGRGPGAGEEPGVDYYEAEITVDELADLIFADLALPNLQPKKKEMAETEEVRFSDVRKTGLMGNLDKKRTILESIRRNAMVGRPPQGAITPEDLRFKTWEPHVTHEAAAVVLAMMDTSGSMGAFEKYIARSFYFWMVRFLRTKYNRVQIVFLAHHTRAKEVSEEEFFTKGESGGTKCSSVYELALQVITERYPPADYNIYPFHFSDGDNLPSDNERCVSLVQELLQVANCFGYGEIVNPYYRGSTLMNSYRKIKDPKLALVTVKDKGDVYPALKAFFHQREELPA